MASVESRCLMLDIEGLTLTPQDKALIAHPHTGGLILFARNYQSPEQLSALCKSIKAIDPKIIIAVDQEGGRVQRFKEGFTRLPAMQTISQLTIDEQAKQALLESTAWLMATELMVNDVDISFAPVLDIEIGLSEVIGDRAFGESPEQVTELASSWLKGMANAGMAATGKHFPGHGSVAADSHIDIPIDERSFEQINNWDIEPFRRLIANNQLQAIMPAHVIYQEVDEKPACFSSFWLHDVLREQLTFDGLIFSDDLTMQGATVMGDMLERCHSAMAAGCDMVLICNDRQAVLETIDKLQITESAVRKKRIEAMLARSTTHAYNLTELKTNSSWQSAVLELQANNLCNN
jgi:beta-N-acetylhexosaminidase